MSILLLHKSWLIVFISFKGNDVTFETFPGRAFISQALACCMTLINVIRLSRHLSPSAVNSSFTPGRIASVSNVSNSRRAGKELQIKQADNDSIVIVACGDLSLC